MSGDGIDVHTDKVAEYAQNIQNMNRVVDKISDYMHTYGCDKSGFTGLLMVLHPAVDLVQSLYDESLKFGRERLTSLSDGVKNAGKAYEQHDEAVAKALEELARGLDTGAPAAG
ncbi:hypothetical protein HUW46_06621 [Amycolatopsis sp. CA-230715]|nr:hypothetical protein HUW46_06621 [Amycolatopsis sp. CA-230715]